MLDKWTAKQNWGTIYNQLAILFEDRISLDPLDFANATESKVSSLVSQFTQN
jgi:hypothetical protein